MFLHKVRQIPTVVTINFTTRNLTFLEENDWLSRSQNRVVVRWQPPQAWLSLRLALRYLQFACANAFLQRAFDNALFLVKKVTSCGLGKRVQVRVSGGKDASSGNTHPSLNFSKYNNFNLTSCDPPLDQRKLKLDLPNVEACFFCAGIYCRQVLIIAACAQICLMMVGPCRCRLCCVLASWVRYLLGSSAGQVALSRYWHSRGILWVPPPCQAQLCLQSWLIAGSIKLIPSNSQCAHASSVPTWTVSTYPLATCTQICLVMLWHFLAAATSQGPHV